MQIYTAESQVRNLPVVLRNMAHGVVHGNYTAYRLALKDIRADYTRAKLGMLWDFLDPLVFVGIFLFLQTVGIFNAGNIGATPYVVFIAFGFLLYHTFMDSVLRTTEIIKKSKNLIQHTRLAPECLILSLFYRLLFDASFRVAILVLISVGSRFVLGETGAFSFIGFIKFLVLFPLIILSGMAIGINLAPLHTIYNDVGRIARLILMPLRFLTPVMYDLTDRLKGHGAQWINLCNPVTSILADLRSLATANTLEYGASFAAWLAIYAVLFLFGWFLFHVSIPILADRA
jgi:teichoic acid transport system permease protein